MIVLLTIFGICIALFALGITLANYSFRLTTLPWYSVTLIGLGILGFFTFGLARIFIRYTINWKFLASDIHRQPTGNIRIEFNLPLWKKLLLLSIPPDLGEVKSEVRYKYSNAEYWTLLTNAVWEDTGKIWTTIRNVGVKTLTMWTRDANNRLFQVDKEGTLLPTKFICNIRLIRQLGEKHIASFDIEYKQESGLRKP